MTQNFFDKSARDGYFKAVNDFLALETSQVISRFAEVLLYFQGYNILEQCVATQTLSLAEKHQSGL